MSERIFKVTPKAKFDPGEYCFYFAGAAGAYGLAAASSSISASHCLQCSCPRAQQIPQRKRR
jgi:hypothetical protein